MLGWRKVVLGLVTATALFVSISEPAEARRRIRFGMIPGMSWGSSMAEKIEKVYDLPDTGTYFNDGKYYDLGSFYTVRDGSEVHPAEPVFVLYNGDRYFRLDAAQLATITEDLGMDPTASFRADYAAKYPAAPPTARSPNEIQRREGETDDQFRERVRAIAASRSSGSAPRDTASSGGSAAGVGASLMMLLLVGGALFLGRKFVRKTIVDEVNGFDNSEPDPAHRRSESFEERVAARMRELQAEPAPATASATAPADRTAGITAPRTFGRRAV